MNETNLTDTIQQGAETGTNWFLDTVKQASLFIKDKIEYLGINFPDYLFAILTVFIGIALIFVGTKLTNKIAKFLLWLFGLLLIIGIVYSFISA